MQPFRHCTAALLLLSIAAGGAAQTTTPSPAPATGPASFTVFIGGNDVGLVQTAVARSGSDWVVTSTGRVGDLTINRFELKYGADWQPIDLRIETTQATKKLTLSTSFGVTTAISEITQNGVTSTKTDQISARTVPLPNQFFGAYEGLAARLAGVRAGAELPLYVVPQAEVKMTVKAVDTEAVVTPTGPVSLRKYDVSIANPGGALEATVAIDDRARFARLDIPAAALSVVRNDLASVAVRTQGARNPTDGDVTIPGNGFTLAGTLTLPPEGGRLRHPAVVLVTGSGPVDRDAMVAGLPIFTQLAGALAAKGFVVLRYDKRGVGQSGGRTETATLQDYAEDLVAVVKWLEKRKDVDKRRLAVAGHSEGAMVATLAAAREKKIKSLVLLSAPGTTGAQLILEQQQHQLAQMNVPEDERKTKVALQQQIQQAVISGQNWDGIPPELRRQADTPWFRSMLTFDPSAVMPRVKQPILIVHGDLDVQVPPHHADKLGELARARKKSPPVQVIHIPGVNHLLAPAKTGEVQEYSQLPEKKISPKVADAIAGWLMEREKVDG
jgi:pimeloyl-ACP methyl ester carboxylesterase